MNKISKAGSLFSTLSKSQKVLLIGASLSLISLFLPWYRDLDAFGKGEIYLGITGPLSIIGFVIMLGSGALLLNMVQKMRGSEFKLIDKFKDAPRLIAGENLLLSIIAASIYLHQGFGFNLTLKETAFGLFLSIVSAITMYVSTYLSNEVRIKEKSALETIDEDIQRMHARITQQTAGNEMTQAEKDYITQHDMVEQDVRAGAPSTETLKMDI